MKNEICEIGVMAPDIEVFNIVNALKKELRYPVKVVQAIFDDAVIEAKKMMQAGVKVLVSRGGTTLRLQQSALRLPIVNIPITEYEIIMMLHRAKQISKEIAVIGFNKPLIKGAEILGPILEVNVRKYIVNWEKEVREKEVQEKVLLAKQDGAEVIIGAKMVLECAEKINLPGVLLSSPEYAIREALNEAEKVLEAIHRERAWGERLKIILDTITEGIISVNEDGDIDEYNIAAEKILKMNLNNKPCSSIFGKEIVHTIKNSEKWIGKISHFGGIKYVCNLNPVIIDTKKAGAIISIQKVSELQELEYKVRKNLDEKGLKAQYQFKDIIHNPDSPMKNVLKRCENYSKMDSSILIYGESGTGKELIAQSIHNASGRKDKPFVAINCASLPENLLESELFGYMEGAFTGAKKGGKTGLFELAHRGSLFLDEIGEISPWVQVRLLRAIEERKIIRVGGEKVIPIDVRIIYATNKDLLALVREGKFREDLYYRINVLKINLPSLKHRKMDIPVLVDYYVEQICARLNKRRVTISPMAYEILVQYDWPGNIRELRNIVERMLVNDQNDLITGEDVAGILQETADNQNVSGAWKAGFLLTQNEINLIKKVLRDTNGNKAKAAKMLGISKSTLWRKLKEMEVETEQ
ncbi:MAG: sigma 54-interacting transcriptional regulator [Desulfitobacteriia bacterium]|jgi:transcriptional regulator with PAS, ATPase and Fis domain